MRLLSDSQSTKPEILQPAAARWTKQYGAARPIKIRLTGPRLLHDRLMVLDGAQVWVLSQSLKNFAARAHASVLRVDDAEVTAQKIHAYEQM